MATGIYQNQEIWFDGYRLTTRLNSVALDYSAEAQDDTTFGDDTRSMKGGLKVVTAQIEGFYDANPYDSALFSNVGVVDKPLSIAASSTEGVVAYTFNQMLGDYAPLKNSVGEMIGFSAGGKATGNLVRGTLMLNQTALAATGSGTARQLGAVGATQRLYAALHVYSVSGTSPTLDVIVESDNGVGMSSPITRITFSQMNAIGSQFTSVAGAITDDYFRIGYTLGGTTPSFSAVVVVGIL